MTRRRTTSPATSTGSMKVARIYMRVSTDEQDLQRQEGIKDAARAAGYYVAGVYREKASGARADRPAPRKQALSERSLRPAIAGP